MKEKKNEKKSQNVEKSKPKKKSAKVYKACREGGKGTGKSQFTKEQVEQALRGCYGIKTRAAASLIQKNGKPLSKQGLDTLVSKYDLFHVLEDCREAIVDLAEVALVKKIRGGDTTSIIFTLKTKGADRGYKEGPKANIVNNIEFDPQNLERLYESAGDSSSQT